MAGHGKRIAEESEDSPSPKKRRLRTKTPSASTQSCQFTKGVGRTRDAEAPQQSEPHRGQSTHNKNDSPSNRPAPDLDEHKPSLVEIVFIHTKHEHQCRQNPESYFTIQLDSRFQSSPYLMGLYRRAEKKKSASGAANRCIEYHSGDFWTAANFTFKEVISWLNGYDLHTTAFLILLDIWVMAGILQLPDLQNEAMRKLRATDPFDVNIPREYFEHIYRNSQTRPLRRLLVWLHVNKRGAKSFADPSAQDYLSRRFAIDVATYLHTKMADILESSRLDGLDSFLVT